MDRHKKPRKWLWWALFIVTILIVGAAVAVFNDMSTTRPHANGTSRCPTADQTRIAFANDNLDRYKPAPKDTARPVVFTPMSSSETLKYDFLRSREPVVTVLSFSLATPSPVIANEIEVAFVGNLVRADSQAIFPIAKYAPSQASIVPWVRPDGRVVEFHVCIDPKQPTEPSPGRYTGTIAWSTRQINVAGQPLIASGQEPVIIRLQYREQYIIWFWGILAILAGVAIKLANDMQIFSGGTSGGGNRDDSKASDGDSAPASETDKDTNPLNSAAKMMEQTANSVNQSRKSLAISTVASVVVGSAALIKGYYGNPEFAADIGGDLWTLVAAVFAATVAAHASVGALQTRS
jgi:hypothetical protein